MKVLVTGSEGFFGSWLLEKEHEVVRYDLKLGNDIFGLALMQLEWLLNE